MIFRAVWSGNLVEEADFLYQEEDVQLMKLEKLMQTILSEIEAIRSGRKKIPIPNLKTLEK